MYPTSDFLIEKIIDSDGEMIDSIFTQKFKKEELEYKYQNFRKEFYNEKSIFFSNSIFVFFFNYFFIFLTYQFLILTIIFSLFALIDLISFIFSIIHYYKKKKFSLNFDLLEKRLYLFFFVNLFSILVLIIDMKNISVDFIFVLNFTVILQFLILFLIPYTKKYLFYISYIFIILILFGFQIFKEENGLENSYFMSKFIVFYSAIYFYLIFIESKFNKFLRDIFFQNIKLRKLLMNKSNQMEGFNFLEFAWLNNQNNFINKDLKDLLYQNKEILIKDNEEILSSSANIYSSQNNLKMEKEFQGKLN
jgi:hypothetical protein